MTTVGFIGSGQIGSAIARLAVEAGHQVVLSNSRGPETLADTAAELGPRASAATSAEAAAAGDILVVAQRRRIPIRERQTAPRPDWEPGTIRRIFRALPGQRFTFREDGPLR